MKPLFHLIALSLCAALAPPSFADDTSALDGLARKIPKQTEGFVSLIDIAAVRDQLEPLPVASNVKSPDLITFGHMNLLGSLRVSDLFAQRRDLTATMGFSLASVSAIASWGKEPQSQSLFISDTPFDRAAINDALSQRGFDLRPQPDIWFRGDDLQLDLKRVRDDPFSSIGQSSRFALRENALHHARSWSMIERMVSDAPRLIEDESVAAILSTVRSTQVEGVPTQIHLLPKQTFSTNGLPPFQRVALVEWQDGATLTGALLLAYTNMKGAKKALSELNMMIERPVQKDLTQMVLGKSAEAIKAMKDEFENPSGPSFVDLIRADPILEATETSGLGIVSLRFSRTADISEGLTYGSLRRSPLFTLTDMLHRGQLHATLGLGR